MKPKNTHTHTERERAKASPFLLILTGRRQRRRHLVYVKGIPVWLTGCEFEALCELVRGRIETLSGIVQFSRLTIFRIRHEINQQTGQPGVGEKLILSGTGEEFSLDCATNMIGRTPCFGELLGLGFLNDPTIETILNAIPKVKQI